MKQSLILLIFIFITDFFVGSALLNAQEVVKNAAFEITIPNGWTQTNRLPQGTDVGFRKLFSEGQEATFFFHYEIMPPEAGEPPTDLSDIQNQWNTIVHNQYPDAKSVSVENPKFNGKLLVNNMYDLTDNGTKVRRLYTYFFAKGTAFVVQCNAPPQEWKANQKDFDMMIFSLKPGEHIIKEIITNKSAISKLEKELPILAGSFPSEWTCSVDNVTISESTSGKKHKLEITLAFVRNDIATIYRATKVIFNMMKSGKSNDHLNNMPNDLKGAATESGNFMKYIGQVWGLASGDVSNCEPPVEQYKVIILDGDKKRIGSVSISREDGTAILTGRVTASEEKRLVSMYIFE
jgi:hypothetical protein